MASSQLSNGKTVNAVLPYLLLGGMGILRVRKKKCQSLNRYLWIHISFSSLAILSSSEPLSYLDLWAMPQHRAILSIKMLLYTLGLTLLYLMDCDLVYPNASVSLFPFFSIAP